MTGNALIARLGPVMQMAYVPKDFDAALAPLDARPWASARSSAWNTSRWTRRSTAAKTVEIDFSIAIAYWGDIQIELIEQHNDAPSIYKRWRDEGREGLHHVCIVVDDMAHARARRAAEAGARVEQEVGSPAAAR